jgi:hypothetical protein
MLLERCGQEFGFLSEGLPRECIKFVHCSVGSLQTPTTAPQEPEYRYESLENLEQLKEPKR